MTYAVSCSDYTKTFKTREAAEHWAEQVTKLAEKFTAGCHHKHIIEEVDE